MNETIAYITNRKNPRLQWFLDSLKRQAKPDDRIQFIMVDSWLWNEPEKRKVEIADLVHSRLAFLQDFIHTPPKPTVWQGPTRLTSSDWWAASNTRNTALCYATGDYVMFIDDLSWPSLTWLDQVRHAATHKYALAGAYQKVKDMVVTDGVMTHYVDTPSGHDHRMRRWNGTGIQECRGDWFYGCSCGMPLESWLTINGYDELADSLSSEDYLCGLRINKLGIKMYYNGNALTYESEEAHFEEGNTVLRSDYKSHGRYPDIDWSHYILALINSGTYVSHGTPDLRELRARLSRGEGFPIPIEPSHHPYTGVPLPELQRE